MFQFQYKFNSYIASPSFVISALSSFFRGMVHLRRICRPCSSSVSLTSRNVLTCGASPVTIPLANSYAFVTIDTFETIYVAVIALTIITPIRFIRFVHVRDIQDHLDRRRGLRRLSRLARLSMSANSISGLYPAHSILLHCHLSKPIRPTSDEFLTAVH